MSTPAAAPPPPRRSPVTTPKAPKKNLPDLPSVVHKEVQRLLAVKCLQLIKTKTINDTEIKKELEKLFHGQGNIASQVKVFIEGAGDYGRLQKLEDVHNTGSSTSSDWERVLDRNIHRQDKDIVIGGNLTAELIKRTAITKTSKKGDMTGRTLLDYARKTIREAKKIYSLVPEAAKHGYLDGPVHGRYSYPSGKTAVNLFHFIFKRMFEWDMYYGATGGWETGEPLERDGDDDDEEEEEPSYDSDYFPHGFFVWWLWGHHPDNDPENYLDVWAVEEEESDGKKKKKKTAGRKADRAQQKKEKESARDYAVANGDQSRGLAYGAASHKELALVEQNERKLNQQELATEIAVLSSLLQSKHNTLKSDNDLLSNMMKLGMEEDARELILSTKGKKEEIDKLEGELKQLVASSKKAKDQSAHTQHFLTIGAKATRLDSDAVSKKRKVIELDGDDNDVDDDNDDVGDQSDNNNDGGVEVSNDNNDDADDNDNDDDADED